jgi:hypothetical protein
MVNRCRLPVQTPFHRRETRRECDSGTCDCGDRLVEGLAEILAADRLDEARQSDRVGVEERDHPGERRADGPDRHGHRSKLNMSHFETSGRSAHDPLVAILSTVVLKKGQPPFCPDAPSSPGVTESAGRGRRIRSNRSGGFDAQRLWSSRPSSFHIHWKSYSASGELALLALRFSMSLSHSTTFLRPAGVRAASRGVFPSRAGTG